MSLVDVFTHKGFKLTGTALNIAPTRPCSRAGPGRCWTKPGYWLHPQETTQQSRSKAPTGLMGCARWRNERAKIQTGRARLTIGA